VFLILDSCQSGAVVEAVRVLAAPEPRSMGDAVAQAGDGERGWPLARARPDSPSGVEASRSAIEAQAESVVDPVHDVWRHSSDASV